jgi:hypothetical protein
LEYLGNYRYYFAFENHASSSGLISERIWDALWGDSVPVYLGNSELDRYISRECYIDATKFSSPKEMLDWLCQLPREVWSNYREAGREFIHGDEVDKFLPDAFARQFVDQVAAIARQA